MLDFSLAIRSKETREDATFQKVWVALLKDEMTQAQKLASNLEGQLVEARAREQQAVD